MLTYAELPRHFNLTSFFLDRNLEQGRGNRIGLIVGDRSYTYDEIARLTNQAGNVLRSLGVEMEDRVLLALSDGIEFVSLWYAIPKIGAVVAEAYTFLKEKDYEYLLNYSRAKVVVVDSTTLKSVRAIAPRCQYLRHILLVGADRKLQAREASFETLMRDAADALEPENTSKDDVAIWKFTTGSTGDPKAAIHCHHDPVVSFEAYAKAILGFDGDDVVLPIPKLFFGYARDLTTLFAFGVGATGVVFPERSTPERIFQLVREHRPTILVNVPTMMNAMLNHPQAAEVDLSSVRTCISSGEALPLEVYTRWMDTFGVEVLEGIGSSEGYHIYISNRPGQARPGSAGQVVPGYEALIVDERGNALPDGETGELWIAGESTALMYWNDHQKSKQTFAGDWIHTGDMFKRDEDGFFWYQGRADELIKSGGIWVSPLEVETVLLQHPHVLECAVVGYEEGGLMLPRAYVVLKGGEGASSAMAEELQEFVRAELSPHKYPRSVIFRDELPKTASGKIDRKALGASG